MIPRYKSLRPKTYDAFLFQQKTAKDRLVKRKAKRSLLGHATARTALIEQLDNLFSLFIRRRDVKVLAGFCLICGKRPIACCYHLVPRSAHSTRWHEENAVGACHACNWAEKNNRILFRHRHVLNFGVERIERMEALSRKRSHFSTADLISMIDELKLKLGVVQP